MYLEPASDAGAEVCMRSILAMSFVLMAGCSSDAGKPSQFIVPSSNPSAGSNAGGGAGRPAGDAGAGDEEPPAADGGAGSSSGGAGSSWGLPCAVDSLLEAHCRGCHSRPPTGGAPRALLTQADLVAASVRDPSRRVADVALERMELGEMPPPPNPAVAADDLQAFAAWVAAGAMRETCDEAPPPADAGAPVVDPYDTPTVCTSEESWDDGDDGDERMHPGGACITCHAEEDDAPSFTIAGTVYPTAHEPTDCNGVDGEDDVEVRVVITGADGDELTLQVNDVGNFYSTAPVALPFNARVVAGGRERRMGPAQMTGDCNGCHTEDGENGAPGRVMAP